jgi:hypothetical protein
LLLVIGGNLERKCLAMGEGGAPVEADTWHSQNGEVNDKLGSRAEIASPAEPVLGQGTLPGYGKGR